jgi:hypothetical protein
VERQSEKTEGDLSELLSVKLIGDFGALHGVVRGPPNALPLTG